VNIAVLAEDLYIQPVNQINTGILHFMQQYNNSKLKSNVTEMKRYAVDTNIIPVKKNHPGMSTVIINIETNILTFGTISLKNILIFNKH
jgi:hypothetical protein